MIVNCTLHETVVVDSDDKVLLKLAPSGHVARVAEVLVQVEVVDRVPIHRRMFGDVVGLPEKVAGTESDPYYCESEEIAREVEHKLIVRRRCACGCPLGEGEGARCWYCEQRRTA